jgi:hypothetical protein
VINISVKLGRPAEVTGVYKTPWFGDPRVNIQNEKGKAKAYQVRQVLKAIERMEIEHGTEQR